MLENTKLYQELEKRQSSYREKINIVNMYAERRRLICWGTQEPQLY